MSILMTKKTRKTAEWIYLDLALLAAGDIRYGQFLLPLTAWIGEDAGTTFIERHIA